MMRMDGLSMMALRLDPKMMKFKEENLKNSSFSNQPT